MRREKALALDLFATTATRDRLQLSGITRTSPLQRPTTSVSRYLPFWSAMVLLDFIPTALARSFDSPRTETQETIRKAEMLPEVRLGECYSLTRDSHTYKVSFCPLALSSSISPGCLFIVKLRSGRLWYGLPCGSLSQVQRFPNGHHYSSTSLLGVTPPGCQKLSCDLYRHCDPSPQPYTLSIPGATERVASIEDDKTSRSACHTTLEAG